MTIEIINGKMLTPKGDWVEFDRIHIAKGRIIGINDETTDFNAHTTINARDCYVAPGLIDLQVSLPEPGYQIKGTIESETLAAAAGGVTTLCCSPDTDPVNDSKAVTKLIEELANQSNHCRVLPLGALTRSLKGEHLSEYAALKQAGCVAMSNAYHPVQNLAITKRCFEYAKTHDLSVFMNPIEPSLHVGAIHESHISTTIGLQGIPSLAETIPVVQLIKLAEATGVHLHLSQLSAADSVAQVRDAKARGLNISADVAIHNLLYTSQQIENFNSLYHCLPPLRSESDRLALLEGVRTGVIDAITSAHQPHENAAKKMPFAETEAGISGIEHLIPMAVKMSDLNELPLACFFEAMTGRASRILKLEKPCIEKGSAANLCIFDLSKKWRLSEENMLSRGKNTPLIGQKIKGRVITTIYDGRISYMADHF